MESLSYVVSVPRRVKEAGMFAADLNDARSLLLSDFLDFGLEKFLGALLPSR